MAPLTADEVITRGEYLERDYDPSKLTIPLLLGVLHYHNVPIPAPYNKAALVHAFQEYISPRATQLGRERLARQGSQASDEGIMDGVTGRQVNRPARRSSAAPAASRASKEPTKRQRASQYRDEVVPLKDDDEEIVEDSEPEGSIPRASEKQGRPKGKGRRLSDITGRELEDDGSGAWSTDYNPFQSGGESSSPARPPTVEKKRLSAVPTKRAGRRSIQPFSSSPPHEEAQLAPRPRRSAAPAARSPPKPRSPTPEEEEEEDEQLHQETAYEELEAADELDLSYNNALEQEAQNTQIARRLAGTAVVPYKKESTLFNTPTSVLLLLMLAFLGGLLESYKLQSSAIGFCDPGSNTNGVLQAREVQRAAAIECSRRTAEQIKSRRDSDAEEAAALEVEDCTPLPLVPLPRPTRCTPCPKHATCAGHTVTCDNGYVLRSHPLAHVPLLSRALDGLPGFGPVALAPQCVVDLSRKVKVARLAKGIEYYLAERRGEKVCAGLSNENEEAGEAQRWGIALNDLREVITSRMTHHPAGEAGGLFEEAIAALLKEDLIIAGVDSAGRKYVTAKEPKLTLTCAVRVRGRQTWREWRTSVFGTFAGLAALVWARRWFAIRAREKRRVAGLVQTALDALRTQEFEHHADPASTRQPYLSPLQLRDWVLQDEHSVSARKRLWKDVEKVVESNANVRANVEEVEGGEETRVWRWVGSSKAPRRVKMEPSRQRIVA